MLIKLFIEEQKLLVGNLIKLDLIYSPSLLICKFYFVNINSATLPSYYAWYIQIWWELSIVLIS